jgi:hypothetical protein
LVAAKKSKKQYASIKVSQYPINKIKYLYHAGAIMIRSLAAGMCLTLQDNVQAQMQPWEITLYRLWIRMEGHMQIWKIILQ